MAALNEAAVQAVELETVREEIPDLMLTEDTFYARLKKAGRVLPMSTSTGGSVGSTFDPTGRPSLRVPMRIAAGSTHQQFSADGGDMGRGSGGHVALIDRGDERLDRRQHVVIGVRQSRRCGEQRDDCRGS